MYLTTITIAPTTTTTTTTTTAIGLYLGALLNVSPAALSPSRQPQSTFLFQKSLS